jgi:exodeoxyribonuclease V gamma subunit
MPIRTVAGERADLLVAALGDRLTGRTDPFTADVVVVPTRGLERYLQQALAERHGICANVAFPTTGEFLARIRRQPHWWDPDRLAWPLLQTIDEQLDQPWAAPLARHLRDAPLRHRSERRLAVARRLASLYCSYDAERPGLLEAWAEPGADVAPDVRWQARLWAALHARLGPGALHHDLDAAGLPDRIAVFGPTRIPGRLLAVLHQIARGRDVDLYLPVPSTALWAADGWPAPGPRLPHAAGPVAVHPLLASLGRDTAELRIRLGGGAALLPADFPGAGLLPQLQRQISSNAPSDLRALPGDTSLQLHACHGPGRQAEVLREAILSVLQLDPSLEPRDVLIMSPDLDTFAPLLSAAFNDPDPRIADLRLAIADQTPQQRNEVLAALDALLTLLTGRLPRSEVLDLLAREPVRQRLGLSAQDVERIGALAGAAGVRWGLDREHRAAWQVPDVDQGTWSWGLDRLVLGTAMSDDGLPMFAGVLPLPDVGPGDIRLVGALAGFLADLAQLRAATGQLRTLTGWVELLHGALESCTAAEHDRQWQAVGARGQLAAYVAQAGPWADQVPLALADVRELLAAVFVGRPAPFGFRLGGLTACRLEPMRSVPHQVVCLVGMDDGAFPRPGAVDGDDVLQQQPRIGERDARTTDRQLLLDAIMAAGKHLIITYTGRDERTNGERQPAVPLAELMDLLPVDAGLPLRHPLQPFDASSFRPPDPFSHDLAALHGAQALQGPRRPREFLTGALPPPDPLPPRSVDSLAKFLQDPVSTFLAQRLGLSSRWDEQEPPESVPLDLGPLDQFGVGERLVAPLLRGADASRHRAAELARGSAPPGGLGAEALDALQPDIDRVASTYRALLAGRVPQPAAVRIDLGRGPVEVVVPDVVGSTIVRATFSTGKPKHALAIWPELLALAAARPGEQCRARISARGATIELDAPPADRAAQILRQLGDLQDDGRLRPVLFEPASARAYAAARGSGGSAAEALAAARGAWPNFPPGTLSVVVGGPATLDLLLQDRHVPAAAAGTGEGTCFTAAARLIWDPLLAVGPAGGVVRWPK